MKKTERDAMVITYQYAYIPGTVTLCAQHAETHRGLGPVSYGAHHGGCDDCGHNFRPEPAPKGTPMPTSHTPGPWTVNEHKGRVHNPNLDTCIARCTGDRFDPDSYDECLANARLIAAAPALLAALRDAQQALALAHRFMLDAHDRGYAISEVEPVANAVADVEMRARAALRLAAQGGER